MAEVMRGFSRTVPPVGRMPETSLTNAPTPSSRTLLEVIRELEGASTELVERNKTIFFPGDPAERVYLIRRGAVLDLGASGWRDAAEAIAGCATESNIKLLALRQLLEQPLQGPSPSALGSQERQLLNLMDALL